MASLFNPWDARNQPWGYNRAQPRPIKWQPVSQDCGLTVAVLLNAVPPFASLTSAPVTGFDFATSLEVSLPLATAPGIGVSMAAVISMMTLELDIAADAAVGFDTTAAITVGLNIDPVAYDTLASMDVVLTAMVEGSLGGAPLLGFTEVVALTLEADLVAPEDLGVVEAAAITLEQWMDAAPSLGIVASALLTREMGAAASADLGVMEAATLTLEQQLAMAADLGVSAAAIVTLELDFAPAPALGVTEAATLTREVDAAAAPGVGPSQASALTLEQQLAMASALGFTSAAALTREVDAAAAAALGFTSAAALTREVDFAVTSAMAATMAAALTRETDFAVTSAMAATMAAAVTRELDLAATSPALGLTTAAALALTITAAAAPALALTMATTLTPILSIPSAAPALAIAEAVAVTLERDIPATSPALAATMAAAVTLKAPPSVIATNSSSTSSAGTSHSVLLPATVAAGDLLVVFFCTPSAAPSTPATWSTLTRDANSTNVGVQMFYKTAAGTEGGTTLTVSTGATSTLAVHESYTIRNWTGTPEKGTAVSATTASPNPPSLTPTFGLANTLWIAMEGNVKALSGTAPAGFSTALNKTVSTTLGIGTAWLQLNASVEDPGTWSTGTSGATLAQTYAFQGA